MSNTYQQGDIWLADLNPTRGKEQRGKRPIVIISDEAFNASGLCIVCALTKTIRKLPGDVILTPTEKNGLDEKSEILTGQIRSISQNRLVHHIGTISDEELHQIFSGLDLLLNRSVRD